MSVIDRKPRASLIAFALWIFRWSSSPFFRISSMVRTVHSEGCCWWAFSRAVTAIAVHCVPAISCVKKPTQAWWWLDRKVKISSVSRRERFTVVSSKRCCLFNCFRHSRRLLILIAYPSSWTLRQSTAAPPRFQLSWRLRWDDGILEMLKKNTILFHLISNGWMIHLRLFKLSINSSLIAQQSAKHFSDWLEPFTWFPLSAAQRISCETMEMVLSSGKFSMLLI